MALLQGDFGTNAGGIVALLHRGNCGSNAEQRGWGQPQRRQSSGSLCSGLCVVAEAALAALGVVPSGSAGSSWCQPHKQHLSRAGGVREKLLRASLQSLQSPKHEVQEVEDVEVNASLSLWVLSLLMIEAFARLIKPRLFCVPEQSGMEMTRKCF